MTWPKIIHVCLDSVTGYGITLSIIYGDNMKDHYEMLIRLYFLINTLNDTIAHLDSESYQLGAEWQHASVLRDNLVAAKKNTNAFRDVVTAKLKQKLKEEGS